MVKRRHFLQASMMSAIGLAGCSSAKADDTSASDTSGGDAAAGDCNCEITSVDGPLLIEPDGGEQTDADMVIKVPSNRMSGNFSIMHGEIGPKQLLAPHTHVHEDQIVYVLNGELVFEVGGKNGERLTAGAGSYVIKPRGIVHGFWNPNLDTVKYVEFSTRQGFEGYVRALKDVTYETALAAGDEYDVYWDQQRTIELVSEEKLLSIRGADFLDEVFEKVLPENG